MSTPLNKKSAKAIFSSRPLVPTTAIGQKQMFSVQSVSAPQDVKDAQGNLVLEANGTGAVLRRIIVALRANSEIAVLNERTKAIRAEAMAAEAAGNTAKAHELFNQYLNKCQLSFNVLSTSSNFGKIEKGDDVKGVIEKVTTENGSLMTLIEVSIAKVERASAKSTWDDEDASTATEDAEAIAAAAAAVTA